MAEHASVAGPPHRRAPQRARDLLVGCGCRQHRVVCCCVCSRCRTWSSIYSVQILQRQLMICVKLLVKLHCTRELTQHWPWRPPADRSSSSKPHARSHHNGLGDAADCSSKPHAQRDHQDPRAHNHHDQSPRHLPRPKRSHTHRCYSPNLAMCGRHGKRKYLQPNRERLRQ